MWVWDLGCTGTALACQLEHLDQVPAYAIKVEGASSLSQVNVLGVGFLRFCVSISPALFYVVSLSFLVQKPCSQPSVLLQMELLCL